jgi:hypothetical protein
MTGFNSKRDAAADKDALFEKFEVAQPAQDVDYWIREATAARQAEMAMRRELEAQPAQEPVATVTSETGNPDVTMSWWHEPALPVGTKLYITPLKREWVGLTDEDIVSCSDSQRSAVIYFAKKLKEKNT